MKKFVFLGSIIMLIASLSAHAEGYKGFLVGTGPVIEVYPKGDRVTYAGIAVRGDVRLPVSDMLGIWINILYQHTWSTEIGDEFRSQTMRWGTDFSLEKLPLKPFVGAGFATKLVTWGEEIDVGGFVFEEQEFGGGPFFEIGARIPIASWFSLRPEVCMNWLVTGSTGFVYDFRVTANLTL